MASYLGNKCIPSNDPPEHEAKYQQILRANFVLNTREERAAYYVYHH